MITASQWQDWLHPRGLDGKFIVKDSWVNVFGSTDARLNDPEAPRMRAKINRLTPQGAHVTYYDAIHPSPDGKPRQLTQAEVGPQYPTVIPVNQLKDRVATAPQPKAKLPHGAPTVPPAYRQQLAGESHAQEFARGVPGFGRYAEAQSIADWTSKVSQFNDAIKKDPELKVNDAVAAVRAGQGTPISDADFAEHKKYLAAVNDAGLGQGLSMDAALKDSYGMWSEEAHLLFEDLVNQAFLAKTANQTKPKNRRAIMSGGLPGSGKSSTLKQMGKARMFHPEDWIITNPDDFKDALVESGHYPQIAGLSPAETSSFTHEASSEMNHMLEQLLLSEGYNVIFDITMGGTHTRDRDDEDAAWVQRLVQDLKTRHNYAVDGLFVDVLPNTSRSRVDERHQQGLDALRTGEGGEDRQFQIKYGGRTVPDSVIAENELKAGDPNAENHNSQNSVNFDRLKDSFDRWAVWNNNADGVPPQFVAGTAKNKADLANMPGSYPPASGAVPGEDAPPRVPGELPFEDGDA